jgi:hypothetical protein
LFRSRLEARYALWLDYMHVNWEYEKEGYVLDGTPYLPDFWLPDYGLYLEVKGQPPTRKELSLCDKLREYTKNAVAIFHGFPRENFGTVFCWDLSDSSGGNSEFTMGLTSKPSPDNSFAMFCEWKWKKDFYSDPLFGNELPILEADTCLHEHGWADIAAIMAKMARFEHGADPRPSWLK